MANNYPFVNPLILIKILCSMVLVSLLQASSSNSLLCRKEERDTLLHLKSAFTYNSSWLNSWNLRTDCCHWNGIECDPSTGHVTRMGLDATRLSGQLSTTLNSSTLPMLSHLDLSSNNIKGIIPGWLFELPSLIFLSLASNFFSGFNESINFPIISPLEEFSIEGNNIRGIIPAWLFEVPSLTNLNLGSNFFTDFNESVNFPIISPLEEFSIEGNNIRGIIPAWLFEVPSLTNLNLGSNFFTDFNESIKFPIISPLEKFSISNNKFQGPIPKYVWELKSLQSLSLEEDKFSDIILYTQLYKLQNLTDLYLTSNNISFYDDIQDNTLLSSLPQLRYLFLSLCNLDEFPSFLRNQSGLKYLSLADNRLYGKLPEWFIHVGRNTLETLNLSNNSLTGRLNLISWSMLFCVDISSNKFEGPIPFLSPTIFEFLASKNQFSGVISRSTCHLSILDLSYNNLSGTLPMCLAEVNGVEVLDLKHNRLEGTIPPILFEHCTSLSVLSLSFNNFIGKIPKLLANCSSMKFLDLQNNQLTGIFPHWLGTIPSLKFLNLGSNNLYGPLHENMSFSNIQFLDLSSNHLSGNLPDEFFIRLTAMVDANGKYLHDQLGYMYTFSNLFRFSLTYYESIYASIKGGPRYLERIMETIVLIDLSNNQFQGQIPDVIGNLRALNSLNLSHNNFIGHIPSSFGNLRRLESLDISCNHLGGRIPTELVNLEFLEDFNVSKNMLEGPVPTANQFGSFQDESYMGNPELCGPFLTNKCEKSHDNQSMVPPALEWGHDSTSSWKGGDNVLMGCGCGMIIGFVAGHYFFVKATPFWLVRFIVWLENMIRRRCQPKQEV